VPDVGTSTCIVHVVVLAATLVTLLPATAVVQSVAESATTLNTSVADGALAVDAPVTVTGDEASLTPMYLLAVAMARFAALTV
jgi:hypothetical protein